MRRSASRRQTISRYPRPAHIETHETLKENDKDLMVHLVTEIDFVDGDEASDAVAQNYQRLLKETVQNAAQGLLLHTIKDAHVESVSVAEIKAEL